MPTPRRYATAAERQAAYRRRLAERRQAELTVHNFPPLQAVASMPGRRRWQALLQHATRLLEGVTTEMEVYYAERSERWQESERGEAFLEHLEAIREAQAVLEELPD